MHYLVSLWRIFSCNRTSRIEGMGVRTMKRTHGKFKCWDIFWYIKLQNLKPGAKLSHNHSFSFKNCPCKSNFFVCVRHYHESVSRDSGALLCFGQDRQHHLPTSVAEPNSHTVKKQVKLTIEGLRRRDAYCMYLFRCDFSSCRLPYTRLCREIQGNKSKRLYQPRYYKEPA